VPCSFWPDPDRIGEDGCGTESLSVRVGWGAVWKSNHLNLALSHALLKMHLWCIPYWYRAS
jgi:hypothetical protein